MCERWAGQDARDTLVVVCINLLRDVDEPSPPVV